MAEGGSVEFCSSNRAHDSTCEYFADGGQAMKFDDLREDQSEPMTQTQPAQKFDDLKDDTPEQKTLMFDDLKEDLDNKNEDLSPADLQAKMVAAANPQGQSKYDTVGQQLLTIGEGAAQGFAGPIATAAELGLSKLGVPNITAEDQKARQERHPVEHAVAEMATLAAGLATGIGEAGIIANQAAHIAEYARMSQKGAAIFKGVMTNGLIAANDDISKILLGQGNPEDGGSNYIAHVGLSGLIGGATGLLGVPARNYVERGAEKLAEAKIGDKMANFLAGIASEANPSPEKSGEALLAAADLAEFNSADFKMGKEFANKVVKGIAGLAPAIGGYAHGAEGLAYGEASRLVTNLISKPLGKKMSEKIMGPIAMKVLASGNAQGMVEALNYGAKMAKGAQTLTKAVDDMFLGSAIMGEQLINNYDKISKWVEDGGNDRELKDAQMHEVVPGFAEGGQVDDRTTSPIHTETNGVAIHYPEQNIVINAAKARVSNYLKSLRPPKHAPKLAFDEEPDNRMQEKSYKRAIAIADKPLSVLGEIAKGTAEPEHIKHLTAMYPEVTGLMQKKITEKIIQAQMDGTKPPYKVRQGMSMLMGTALSSEMAPQNIQAAQAVFVKAKSEEDSGKKAKKAKALPSLTKSDDAFLTSTQARVQRSQSAR